MGKSEALDWILSSDEPWARFLAYRDIAGVAVSDPAVANAKREMLQHPLLQQLVARAREWPGYALKRHNDAAHPLYAITTLADFGLVSSDAEVDLIAEAILQNFDGDEFETLVWLPRFLTKEKDDERWTWMLCDAPSLLYALLSFGYASHPDVERAVAVLLERVEHNGWRCGAASSLPSFSGPGRKLDTCPIATTYALKALALVPEAVESDGASAGVSALLDHWEHQTDYKLKMFGIGTDFRKLKYPFVWYDILHVADVLSRYPQALGDSRLAAMVGEITNQADNEGRFCAGSMYRAWKDWSFADKKQPSPHLTMLVLRIEQRLDSTVARSATSGC